MRTTVLGTSGITVTNTAFGCLPIQRISTADAGAMLRRAVDAGITFFDTARAYSDSEEKMGIALRDVRDRIIIATKTGASDAKTFWQHLEMSLRMLQTDHVDIYQFHNPSFVPKPEGEDGLYDAALEARRQGKIRAISITQHSIELAEEAVNSGLYDTIQYPFNHLASDREIALVERCAERNVGFIAMKALSGGLITDASIPFAFLSQYPHVVPIWGFQHPWELENLLELEANPPILDPAMQARIDEDRQALKGAFCRGCGYCMPCPVDIPIFNANRMTQLITRSPSAQWMTPYWREGMERITQCTQCGLCHTRCPYGLKPYETLPGHLQFYRAYVQEHE